MATSGRGGSGTERQRRDSGKPPSGSRPSGDRPRQGRPTGKAPSRVVRPEVVRRGLSVSRAPGSRQVVARQEVTRRVRPEEDRTYGSRPPGPPYRGPRRMIGRVARPRTGAGSGFVTSRDRSPNDRPAYDRPRGPRPSGYAPRAAGYAPRPPGYGSRPPGNRPPGDGRRAIDLQSFGMATRGPGRSRSGPPRLGGIAAAGLRPSATGLRTPTARIWAAAAGVWTPATRATGRGRRNALRTARWPCPPNVCAATAARVDRGTAWRRRGAIGGKRPVEEAFAARREAIRLLVVPEAARRSTSSSSTLRRCASRSWSSKVVR